METPSRRSRASDLAWGAPRASAPLHRTARKHGVRLHGSAVTAASCVGAIALYLTLRGGISTHMRALSIPFRQTAQLLSGAVPGLQCWSRPQPQRRCGAATADCGSSSGALAGHSVRRVKLPPRVLPGQLCGPTGPPAPAGQGESRGAGPAPAASQAAALMRTCATTTAVHTNPVPNPMQAPASPPVAATASAGTVTLAAAAAVLLPTPATAAAGEPQQPGLQPNLVEPSGPAPAGEALSAALESSGADGTGDCVSSAPAGVTASALDVEGGVTELEVHLMELSQLPAAAVGEALRGLAAEEVLGLDAEWEPELLPGARNRISVLQLSTARQCWILRPDWPKGPHTAETTTAKAVAAAEAEAASAAAGGGAAAGTLPDEVVRLLIDPRVIKAGVGIQEDVRRLERDFGVQVRGAVDVRLVAQRVAPECLAAGASLRAMTSSLLGRLLDKSAQRSHWGAGQLDEHQIAYAAHDAWLSRELLCELYRLYERNTTAHKEGDEHQRHRHQHQAPASGEPVPAAVPAAAQPSAFQLPTPTAPQPAAPPTIQTFASAFMDIFTCLKPKRVEKVLGYAGAPSRGGGASLAAASRSGAVGGIPGGDAAGAALPGLRGKGSGGAAAQKGACAAVGVCAEAWERDVSGENGADGDARRRRKERKLPTRKSVLYENCRLLAPDGEVLCTCGAKKVRWYIERGLARVVSENPTTIQLNFQPRGRGHADDAYYLSDKENRCCVCGSEGEYLRHSVVPHCYRQHFPTTMKSHLSHDIVLMCPGCHKACSVADQRRMEAIGAQYEAPLGAATAAKFLHDTNLGAVRSAGRALANTKVVIPDSRRRELEEVLRRHFGVEEVDAALVREAADVDPRAEDVNWRSHAELVVQALGGREALEAFVRGWRRHFLDTMRPRFLPPYWHVDARVANSAADADAGAEGAVRRRSDSAELTSRREEDGAARRGSGTVSYR